MLMLSLFCQLIQLLYQILKLFHLNFWLLSLTLCTQTLFHHKAFDSNLLKGSAAFSFFLSFLLPLEVLLTLQSYAFILTFVTLITFITPILPCPRTAILFYSILFLPLP